MYQLQYARSFWKAYHLVTKGNEQLKRRVVKTLRLLQSNPLHPSLKSHKANTREFGRRWSVRVTGDIRIIWDYDKQRKLTILVLTIGGHTGTATVYR